jgi:hypothetical protein
MFIELTIDKFQIINIFPESAFQRITDIGNQEIQQINHIPSASILFNQFNSPTDLLMIYRHENLYLSINITYHDKYTPFAWLSYGPYDCPLCPVERDLS